ncbi:MAG: ATP-binding cassette domain-containing protein [Proteobacteria bacterium]|nr:ATP-binding cassette domain-containing protein [Pseudomonadota bacterium]
MIAATTRPALLRTSALTCRLGQRVAVDGVRLEVQAGEVVGVVGPNGAGKTTLLRLVAGCEPLQGSADAVWLDQTAIGAWPLWRRARAGIGYLAQGNNVLLGLDAQRNLELVLELRRVKERRLRRARAIELLALFGLAAQARQRAGTLSGGERRRLELARIVALSARVVLLDEPFAGLDAQATATLAQAIALLAGGGVAVVLADHRVEVLARLCQRLVVMFAGRVVDQGPTARVLADEGMGRMLFNSAATVD